MSFLWTFWRPFYLLLKAFYKRGKWMCTLTKGSSRTCRSSVTILQLALMVATFTTTRSLRVFLLRHAEESRFTPWCNGNCFRMLSRERNILIFPLWYGAETGQGRVWFRCLWVSLEGQDMSMIVEWRKWDRVKSYSAGSIRGDRTLDS